jgi:hypothetical protein
MTNLAPSERGEHVVQDVGGRPPLNVDAYVDVRAQQIDGISTEHVERDASPTCAPNNGALLTFIGPPDAPLVVKSSARIAPRLKSRWGTLD